MSKKTRADDLQKITPVYQIDPNNVFPVIFLNCISSPALCMIAIIRQYNTDSNLCLLGIKTGWMQVYVNVLFLDIG